MRKNLVEKMLESEVASQKRHMRESGRKRQRGYLSVQDFVLKHGQEFQAAPLPKGMRRRKAGACFTNGLLLAMESGGELTYVEGYACKSDGLIVHHAWGVNSEQEVTDRTWEKPEECYYFGVPFTLKFIREQSRETRWLESVITPGDVGRETGIINPRLLEKKADFKHHFE